MDNGLKARFRALVGDPEKRGGLTDRLALKLMANAKKKKTADKDYGTPSNGIGVGY